MPALRFATSIAALACSATVHAQPSMLRLACDEDSARAEVTLNGKFVGECPLDVQVPAGTVRIQAAKRVDAQRERSFEEEFRIGPGVAKRVQIELGPVGPNAEARRLGALEEERAWKLVVADKHRASLRRFLARYPQGRFAAEAQREMAALPQRPQFPPAVREDVLDKLELSEAFRNWPRSRAASFISQTSTSLGPGTLVMKSSGRLDPHGDGFTREVRRVATSGFGQPASTESEGFLALGGLIPLASTTSMPGGGRHVSYVRSLDELSGSLLPPRAGAAMRFSYVSASTSGPTEVTVQGRCTMEAAVPAASVSGKLAGQAWPVRCLLVVGSSETQFDMHYLEDYFSLTWSVGLEKRTEKSLTGTPAATVVDRLEFAFE